MPFGGRAASGARRTALSRHPGWRHSHNTQATRPWRPTARMRWAPASSSCCSNTLRAAPSQWPSSPRVGGWGCLGWLGCKGLAGWVHGPPLPRLPPVHVEHAGTSPAAAPPPPQPRPFPGPPSLTLPPGRHVDGAQKPDPHRLAPRPGLHAGEAGAGARAHGWGELPARAVARGALGGGQSSCIALLCITGWLAGWLVFSDIP